MSDSSVFKQRFYPLFISAASAVLIALLVDITLILIFSDNPGSGIDALLSGPFRSRLHLGRTLTQMTYLLISGLAMSLSFQGGHLNFGGEGQIYAGGLTATLIWLQFPEMPPTVGIWTGIIAGGICSGILAGISGILKATLKVNEILSTYLVSASAIFIADALLTGPLLDPKTYLIATSKISESYRLQSWLPPSSFSGLALLALLLLLLLYLFLYKTRTGIRIKLTAGRPELAKIKQLPQKSYTVLLLAGSGFIFGLLGAGMISGQYHQFIKGYSSGLGWNGISVSLLAGNNPLGILFSAFTLSSLFQGTELAAVQTASGQKWVLIMQAIILILVSSRLLRDSLQKRRLRIVNRSRS